MKSPCYIILIILTLFFFSCKREVNRDDANRLKKLDMALISDPYRVRDSLDKIKVAALDEANSAYYWLLSAVTNERCGVVEKEDSMIIISEKHFKDRKDYMNFCRSVLYKGVIRYNQYKQDTLTATFFSNVGNLMLRYRVNDPATKATLYKYLGKLKRANGEFANSAEYLRKSRQLSEEINDSLEVRRLDLELFYVNLAQKDYSQALANIAHYIDSDTTNPLKAYELNEAISQFFIEREEFDIAIVYLRNMLEMSGRIGKGVIDRSQLYHRISLYYKNKNMLDTAISYSRRSLAALNGNASTNGHVYYNYIAGLYEAKGDLTNAIDNYKKAYESHKYTYSNYTSKNVSRIESLYETSVKEADLQNERNNRKYFTLLGIMIIGVLTSITLLLRKRVKNFRDESHLAKKEIRKAENEVSKMKFVNELNEMSIGLLYQLMRSVSIEADRSRAGASDTADRLVQCISQTKKSSKERIAEIVQNNFISDYPNLQYLSNLTDFEKVVFVLLDNGYSIREVAALLDRTQSCISGEKSKIKEKILSRQDLPFDPKVMFSIFN
jgi:tetratricopeptide (TPR) repeat protein